MGTKNKKKVPCKSCDGTGWVMLLITRIKCPDCKGTGFVDARPVVSDKDHDDSILGEDAEFDENLEFDDEEAEDDSTMWHPAHVTFFNVADNS